MPGYDGGDGVGGNVVKWYACAAYLRGIDLKVQKSGNGGKSMVVEDDKLDILCCDRGKGKPVEVVVLRQSTGKDCLEIGVIQTRVRGAYFKALHTMVATGATQPHGMDLPRTSIHQPD